MAVNAARSAIETRLRRVRMRWEDLPA